jgi:hypothetical protein
MVTPSSLVIVFVVFVFLVVVVPFILFVSLVVWLFSNEGFHKCSLGIAVAYWVFWFSALSEWYLVPKAAFALMPFTLVFQYCVKA